MFNQQSEYDCIALQCGPTGYIKMIRVKDMTTQITQTPQKELTSVRDLEWTARQGKVVASTFLVSGIGVALILVLGTLLGN